MVVAGCLLAALTACGTSSGTDASNSPTEQAGVVDATSSDDPAVQIAALDTGDMTPPEDVVIFWRARLGLLQTYCTGSLTDMSDTIVAARKAAKENGANVSYQDAAVGITHVASVSGGAQGQNCDHLAAIWITSVSR